MAIAIILIIVLIGLCIYYYKLPKDKLDEKLFGKLNPDIVCPHCQTKGSVRTKVKISSGDRAAALLTRGVSLLVGGPRLTEAHCTKCESTWTF
jgi:hypothetical protein